MNQVEDTPEWVKRVTEGKPVISARDMITIMNTQEGIVKASGSAGKTIKTDLYGWAHVVDISPGEQSVILYLQLPGTYDPEDVYKIRVPNEWLFEVSRESLA